ncbi:MULTISPECIES: SLATT domain-containing protein [unclassified Xanthomonas]|uniref:SLATT domain-containing protein n=1 Tax=Xanthomonas sp. LMG 9002 TaxID=1591158 RepID=UPI00136F3E85|nr:SLATT domain-containing protein [Xanthomonas sp. LMG 9002]MXV06309.1 SLATT domain-containing protein [Xanthomonas sp. LMG 9002]
MQLKPSDVPQSNQEDRLLASIKTTAISRYNASNRLARQGRFTFSVSTLFSLGLIFVPLMQLAKAPLLLSGDVLSAIQIFLAVAILVYSIIIGFARYQIRSEQLNDSGDKLKSLIRELRSAGSADDGGDALSEFRHRYESIIADVENHERRDYILTILRSPDLFELTREGRIYHWIKFCFAACLSYLPSLALVAIEVVLITDMFGATRIFTPYLTASGGA